MYVDDVYHTYHVTRWVIEIDQYQSETHEPNLFV